jgi:RecA-family ATPase
MSDINELTLTRVIDPFVFNLIPRYLFEQIDGMDKEGVDNMITCGSSIITTLISNDKGQLFRTPNPLVHIVVMTDLENKIKGFFWAAIDVIEKHIFIYAMSVDKKYQPNTADFSDAVTKYLFDLPIEVKFKQKIVSATTRPKAFERYGWSRSKRVLMEYSPKENRDVISDTGTAVPESKIEAA